MSEEVLCLTRSLELTRDQLGMAQEDAPMQRERHEQLRSDHEELKDAFEALQERFRDSVNNLEMIAGELSEAEHLLLSAQSTAASDRQAAEKAKTLMQEAQRNYSDLYSKMERYFDRKSVATQVRSWKNLFSLAPTGGGHHTQWFA